MGNCKTNFTITPSHSIGKMTESKSGNTDQFCFTRYLYEKEEVKYAFVTSLLTKKEEALFWAYELHYSGWTEELIQLLFIVYYDFYASLNPSFETYLQQKTKLLLKPSEESGTILAMIVHSLSIRPSTTDVFFARVLTKGDDPFWIPFLQTYEMTQDVTILEKELPPLIDARDYLVLAWVLFYKIDDHHLSAVFTSIVDHFTINYKMNLKKETLLNGFLKKEKKSDSHQLRHWLFAKIIHLVSLAKKVEMGKNLYVHVEPEETVLYETVVADLKERGNGSKRAVLPAYQVLPKTALYSIDEDNYLSLFRLKRDRKDIREAYLKDWLYYSHLSPVWKKRIEENGGATACHDVRMIEFTMDDGFENFYENYGYEPDEQSVQTQNKSIQPIKTVRTWQTFYNQQKGRGVIELQPEVFESLGKIAPF
jgi:hypothetical protein